MGTRNKPSDYVSYDILQYKLNNSSNIFKISKLHNVDNFDMGINLKYCNDFQNNLNFAIDMLENSKKSLVLDDLEKCNFVQDLLHSINSDITDGWIASGQFLLAYSYVHETLMSVNGPDLKFIMQESSHFLKLYEYLGRSDLCFRDNLDKGNIFLRNNRVYLSSNTNYLDMKDIIRDTQIKYYKGTNLVNNKFLNHSTIDPYYTQYNEYYHHLKLGSIGVGCLCLTAVGCYFFY